MYLVDFELILMKLLAIYGDIFWNIKENFKHL